MQMGELLQGVYALNNTVKNGCHTTNIVALWGLPE
jgi:hypothetical protein